jgi:hypothetical protein
MATSNNIATFTHNLSFTGFDDDVEDPPTLIVEAPYADGELAIGGIGIPKDTSCDEEYDVNFGSIEAATGILIRNRAHVDVAVRLDGGTSVIGTLVSGTKNMTLHFAHGERLSVVRNDSNGGDEGALSVNRISVYCVNVTSYDEAGIADSDVSTVEVFNSAPMSLPNEGVISVSMPKLPNCSPISQAQIITTTQQPRDGAVGVKLFGSPA